MKLSWIVLEFYLNFFLDDKSSLAQIMTWWSLGDMPLFITNLHLMLHICVIELGQHWFRLWLVAITWPDADLLSIEPLGTNFSEIQIGIQHFSFMKMNLETSSAKWQPFCLREDELNQWRKISSVSWGQNEFIHWGLSTMATILQMTFSNTLEEYDLYSN